MAVDSCRARRRVILEGTFWNIARLLDFPVTLASFIWPGFCSDNCCCTFNVVFQTIKLNFTVQSVQNVNLSISRLKSSKSSEIVPPWWPLPLPCCQYQPRNKEITHQLNSEQNLRSTLDIEIRWGTRDATLPILGSKYLLLTHVVTMAAVKYFMMNVYRSKK